MVSSSLLSPSHSFIPILPPHLSKTFCSFFANLFYLILVLFFKYLIVLEVEHEKVFWSFFFSPSLSSLCFLQDMFSPSFLFSFSHVFHIKCIAQMLDYLWLSTYQISRSVMSDSLQPHEPQHARPPCLSPTPGVHSDSRPSSQWCHPAISFSVIPFSSCPPIPPSIRVFSNESTLRMRWPKYWSFSFSIIPSKEIPELISFRMDLYQSKW